MAVSLSRLLATPCSNANPLLIAMKKLFSLALASLLLLPSCSVRLMDMTVVTTKNIDLNNLQGYITATNGRVNGKTTRHVVCLIPLGGLNYKDAVDDAIQKNGSSCVGLSNAVLKAVGWNVLLYGQESIVVEGDPIYKK